MVKKPPTKAGDMGSNPRSGRSLGEGNGKPLQYSCLENPIDRRAWQARVQGVGKGGGYNWAAKSHPVVWEPIPVSTTVWDFFYQNAGHISALDCLSFLGNRILLLGSMCSAKGEFCCYGRSGDKMWMGSNYRSVASLWSRREVGRTPRLKEWQAGYMGNHRWVVTC